jgi:RHS repeat-associated protein
MGSLIEGGRDLTGQMYMRNRFYDPATGRFTQEDPIGIAGGLNVYGVASGDPVTYSDPYGLCAQAGEDTVPKTVCSVNPSAEEKQQHTAAQRLFRISHGDHINDQGLGGLELLIPVGGEAKVAEEASVSLYRAVSQAEFDQLMETGVFHAGSNSLGGKWFATTAANAAKWGEAMYRGEAFRIVEARVPRNVFEQMMHMTGRFDGIGPAVYAELEQLTGALVRAL